MYVDSMVHGVGMYKVDYVAVTVVVYSMIWCIGVYVEQNTYKIHLSTYCI